MFVKHSRNASYPWSFDELVALEHLKAFSKKGKKRGWFIVRPCRIVYVQLINGDRLVLEAGDQLTKREKEDGPSFRFHKYDGWIRILVESHAVETIYGYARQY